MLKNLIGITLDSIEYDNLSIARLLEASQSSLKDAQLKGLSNESRFDLAYKSIIQASNAALQANGYRVLTSKPGHHQTLIQTLALTIGTDTRTLITLDQLRKQRNAIDYLGDIVSDAMLNELMSQAQMLSIQINEWLVTNATGFLRKDK
ncbi:DNA-binding protein [Polynucleobacter antarcticus]|uniref:DNA-binding protein n=1 Tax=Polynucleobacter antarcticus TaxID=1743162 RepID=UPI001C2D9416|nr:DNA-binding protein [Polynucleobacter antarcticus]